MYTKREGLYTFKA